MIRLPICIEKEQNKKTKNKNKKTEACNTN